MRNGHSSTLDSNNQKTKWMKGSVGTLCSTTSPVMCQFGCNLPAWIWCVSSAVRWWLRCICQCRYHLSTFMFIISVATCQLSCILELRWQLVSCVWQTNILAAINQVWLQCVSISAQLEHRLSAGMRPARSQLSCLYMMTHDQLLCTMWALGAICQLCKCHVSSAAML